MPGHITDRARLVLAQPRLAGAPDLFQQSAEAGFGLAVKMVGHPAGAMEFVNVDAHAVPVAPRRRQAQHIFGQRNQAVDAGEQRRMLQTLKKDNVR